jgi:hypothetical protein
VAGDINRTLSISTPSFPNRHDEKAEHGAPFLPKDTGAGPDAAPGEGASGRISRDQTITHDRHTRLRSGRTFPRIGVPLLHP